MMATATAGAFLGAIALAAVACAFPLSPKNCATVAALSVPAAFVGAMLAFFVRGLL